MQFIPAGPDLPLDLLRAHDAGDLVLFCGSGISVPAGLPTFKGLAIQVLNGLGAELSRDERREFRRGHYDRLLGMLAGDDKYGRRRVVEAVRKALTPVPQAPLTAHQALLALATTRTGVIRLITTNFDDLFERAGPGLRTASAPLLPVPKPQKWDSLVYLHGRFADEDPEGRHLVLTAGDFGVAYLTERWASRFVAEMFNHFEVLFIGYSAEDPPMRYLVDALAAERQGDRRIRQAYALAPAPPGREGVVADTWRARGIIPILYDPRDGHAALRETLTTWAGVWRGGLRSRQNLVREYGPKDPTRLGPELVSQVCWAVSEPRGTLARLFAELEPVPPLAWITFFEKEGLLSRPPQVQGEARLPLAGHSHATGAPPSLDPVTRLLGAWLSRHLGQSDLIRWVLESGGHLHPDWAAAIRHKLDGESPPAGAVAKVWRILSQEPRPRTGGLGTPSVFTRMRLEAWSPQLRHDLVQALTPCLELGSAWSRGAHPSGDAGEVRVRDLVSVECVLRAGDILPSLMERLNTRPDAEVILRDLAWDLTELLRHALDLLAIAEQADATRDPSNSQHTFIKPGYERPHGAGWIWLIELARRAFDALAHHDPSQAQVLAQRWMGIPFPVFRRLVLYGAAAGRVPDAREVLEFLLREPRLTLWSASTHRDLLVALPRIWTALDEPGRDQFSHALLEGPPRPLYREDLSADEWEDAREHAVWERLVTLQGGAPPLDIKAAGWLQDVERRHPEWARRAGADRGVETSWVRHSAATLLALSVEDLVELLLATIEDSELLREARAAVGRDPVRGVQVLVTLAARGAYPTTVWRAVLGGLAGSSAAGDPALLDLLTQVPQAVLDALAGQLADLARTFVKEASGALRPRILAVWDQAVCAAARQVPPAIAPARVDAAINHPMGILTEALFTLLHARELRAGCGLPPDVRERLERLLAVSDEPGRLARVIIGSRVVLLHQLDPEWTRRHVIPLFAWSDAGEAVGAWQGYLWSPTMTFDLWPDLRPHFLDAFGHLPAIGREHGRNLASMLAAVAIEPGLALEPVEALSSLRRLDDDGRGTAAHWLAERLEGAGDQAAALWRERIGPWIQASWPKELPLRGPGTTRNLARATILARGAFPDAAKLVRQFLVPLRTDASLVLQALLESQHLKSSPAEALDMLSLITPDDPEVWFGPLKECLSVIEAARPELATEPRFQRLRDIAERLGF